MYRRHNQSQVTGILISLSVLHRYKQENGSSGKGIKTAGRQTGGRQIKRTLLVSAHCATLISFYFLIGWLL